MFSKPATLWLIQFFAEGILFHKFALCERLFRPLERIVLTSQSCQSDNKPQAVLKISHSRFSNQPVKVHVWESGHEPWKTLGNASLKIPLRQCRQQEFSRIYPPRYPT